MAFNRQLEQNDWKVFTDQLDEVQRGTGDIRPSPGDFKP